VFTQHNQRLEPQGVMAPITQFAALPPAERVNAMAGNVSGGERLCTMTPRCC